MVFLLQSSGLMVVLIGLCINLLLVLKMSILQSLKMLLVFLGLELLESLNLLPQRVIFMDDLTLIVAVLNGVIMDLDRGFSNVHLQLYSLHF